MSPRARPPAETRVTWDGVAAFRLQRHHLLERAGSKAVRRVLADMGGAQAQVPLAAFMSVAARVSDLEVGDLERATWTDRTLARAWCMRRTVHLLPADQLAVFVRGTTQRAEREVTWMRRHAFGGDPLEALIQRALGLLDEPCTLAELAERLARSMNLRKATHRGGGWGNDRKVEAVEVRGLSLPMYYLLHLLGARGVVCAGPNRGTQSTYVRADSWIPRWHDLPVAQAETDLLRLYLRGFGPATPSDFMAWTRMPLKSAQTIWSRVESELAPVDVQGHAAWLLRSDLRELNAAEFAEPSVRLLPYFDSFLLGHLGREHLVSKSHHMAVYREQGWISPVLLVNGRVAGVWSHAQKPNGLTVKVTPFGALTKTVRARIRQEAREIGRFLGTPQVIVSLP